jgi:3-deoxy-D-manno-octulosonate 8-phosphate phosphatase (KDO 8-P phosphatase)
LKVSGDRAAGGKALDGKARRPTGDRIPEEVARAVKLVILDVDGVLTDAGVYMGTDGAGEVVELKRFDIQDGLGIQLMGAAGIKVALVSGRVSRATEARARELGLEECHQEAGARKLPVVREIMGRMALDWSQVAMMGDDLPDLPVLRKVGLPVAVGNAVREVRQVATWTTRREGGRGAVREFSRVLLETRGEWDDLVEAYCAARSDD